MSYHIRLGEPSNDFEISWDGFTASFLIGAGENMLIGGDTHNSEFEPDGTLVFNGNATIWDDLRVSALSIKLGSIKQPTFEQLADDGASSTGVYTYMFADDQEQQIFFSVQLPHSYKEGSSLYPHIHWSPQTTDVGNVNWFLEYTIANIDGTFGNTDTITMGDNGSGTINSHLFTPSTNPGNVIEDPTITISNMLICRLYRNGGVGSDDFVGKAALLEFDIHFEMDTVGSRDTLTK